jgi:hypothetical protein
MAYGMKPPSRVADTPTARSWPAGHDAHLLTKEPLVKKHLLAVVAAIAMLAAAAPAHAAKSCGSLRVSGPWGSGVHVTVRVMKGNVGCVEARRLARALFTAAAATTTVATATTPGGSCRTAGPATATPAAGC